MSRTNEARYVTWHKTYKCRLDASVFNNYSAGIMMNADVNEKN